MCILIGGKNYPFGAEVCCFTLPWVTTHGNNEHGKR